MMQCRRRRRHFFNESRLQNEPATGLKILARVNVTAHAVNVNALILRNKFMDKILLNFLMVYNVFFLFWKSS